MSELSWKKQFEFHYISLQNNFIIRKQRSDQITKKWEKSIGKTLLNNMCHFFQSLQFPRVSHMFVEIYYLTAQCNLDKVLCQKGANHRHSF